MVERQARRQLVDRSPVARTSLFRRFVGVRHEAALVQHDRELGRRQAHDPSCCEVIFCLRPLRMSSRPSNYLSCSDISQFDVSKGKNNKRTGLAQNLRKTRLIQPFIDSAQTGMIRFMEQYRRRSKEHYCPT